ncbi:MAG: hypothetical protein AAF089_18525 [Bacteroidota bacterium]
MLHAPSPPRPDVYPSRAGIALACLLIAWGLLSGCGASAPIIPPATALDQEPPRLLNAFFGLDDALPRGTRILCRAAPGSDGMPVTFSRRVLSVDADDFAVVTESGARKTPGCATVRPADAASESHTVLLIGDLGTVEDPPVRVEVVGDLPLEAGGQGRGLTVEVTPLEAGPTLVLAIAYAAGTIASDCPASTQQIVQVTWAGGVERSDEAEEDAHRTMYRVRTADGEVTPAALGDLDDNDNYEHLCLDTVAGVREVSAQAGVLVDPRGDLNPATAVEVKR